MARLLLWTLPQALPTDQDAALDQYVAAWRPGAITGGGERAEEARRRWPDSYGVAVEAVLG